jgi:hypothetical protein
MVVIETFTNEKVEKKTEEKAAAVSVGRFFL